MNEIELLNRKLVLKRQALKLFAKEIEDLEDQLALAQMKQRAESQMSKEYDPKLSRRLDCINYLVEN